MKQSRNIMNEVYVADIGVFLPGNPIGNDEIENILDINDAYSKKVKNVVLRSNGIKQRHYAIDPETKEPTYNNAQLTAEAIKKLHPYENFKLSDIEALCCGTTSPDQMVPGHASMVHGELANIPCEIASFAGVCCSSMAALKYAYMNVKTGLKKNSVATGSENSSSLMRNKYFKDFSISEGKELESKVENQFYSQFLRFMLSDASSAAFLTSGKPKNLAYRIDWLDIISYANEMETCMYGGAQKQEDGSLKGWRNFSKDELAAENILILKQDIPLLTEKVMEYTVEKPLNVFKERYNLQADEFDWFLPHYSSHYFRDKVLEKMENANFIIPQEKWFTNLYEKGNTGSASMFIIMEELLRSGNLKKGDKLLCYNPESGRFSSSFMGLTAV